MCWTNVGQQGWIGGFIINQINGIRRLMRKSWLLQWTQGMVGWGDWSKGRLEEDIETVISCGSRAIPMCEHGRELDGLGDFPGWRQNQYRQDEVMCAYIKAMLPTWPWRRPPAWVPFLRVGVASPAALGRELPCLSTKTIHSPSWGLSLLTWNMHMSPKIQSPLTPRGQTSVVLSVFDISPLNSMPVVSTLLGVRNLSLDGPLLCSLGQITSPLWVSVSSTIKWGSFSLPY